MSSRRVPPDAYVFNVQAHAFLSEYTQGWTLQPDINQAVYLPITEVHPGNHTITVSGLYAAIGTAGTHWRVYAPPGTETYGPYAGTLSHWASAVSSRCLWNGYRFESPLAGFHDYTGTGQVIRRQTGDNFAGQHYTLHRHYDPVLMRFTSPDPIAADFWNLHGYCGNNPAGAYDPDGLRPEDGPMIWSGGSEFDGRGDNGGMHGGSGQLYSSGPTSKTGTWRDFVYGASYESRELLTGSYGIVGAFTGGKGIYGLCVSEEEFGEEYGVDPDTTAFQGGRVAVVVAVEVTAAIATGGLSTTRLAPTALRTTTTLVRVEQRAATTVSAINRTVSPVSKISPRLAQRLQAWKAYKSGGGTKSMAQWVRSTQGQSWGTGFQSGFARWSKSVNSLHGNAALSGKQAFLYRLMRNDNTFLKWGVTQDLNTRYTKAFMADKHFVRVAEGTRDEMLKLERLRVLTDPGEMNFERWAGKLKK